MINAVQRSVRRKVNYERGTSTINTRDAFEVSPHSSSYYITSSWVSV